MQAVGFAVFHFGGEDLQFAVAVQIGQGQGMQCPGALVLVQQELVVPGLAQVFWGKDCQSRRADFRFGEHKLGTVAPGKAADGEPGSEDGD